MNHTDPLLDITRALAAERRQPLPRERSHEQRQLDDLRKVIHILATALGHGR